MRKKKPKKHDPLAQFRQPKRDTKPLQSNAGTVTLQEEIAAEMIGGSRHRGSGALDWLKSDASSPRYQLEAKQTYTRTISITHKWLKKISLEAVYNSKVPLMHLKFCVQDMEMYSDSWVLVPEAEFRKLLGGEVVI